MEYKAGEKVVPPFLISRFLLSPHLELCAEGRRVLTHPATAHASPLRLRLFSVVSGGLCEGLGEGWAQRGERPMIAHPQRLAPPLWVCVGREVWGKTK